MFPAGDQPQPEEPEDATCKTACTSPPYTRTSVPVPQSADGNPPKRKRNRDTCEIHLEVLDAEKDKLRLECEYIKLKMKKKYLQTWMQKNSLRNCFLTYLSLSKFSEV